ncbi:DNA-binding protein, partial [Lacticaseibacillus rhamnosus]
LFQKGNHVVVKHPLTVGINYVFSGLNQAIIRVILHYSSKELSAFLQSFRWLLTSTDPSPERWEALGSWYLGRYLLDPSKANADQVELYVHESLRIGHPNAITNLKSFNIKHLPKGFIDKFVSSYKD